MRFAIAALLALTLVATALAQEAAQPAADAQSPATAEAQPDAAAAPQASEGASPFAFKGGITLGSDVLPSGSAGASETWTLLGFQPDVSFGKIGVGLDLSLHFMLYPEKGTSFKVYPGDWVPDYKGNGKSVLDVYLPKILYVRYGQKGEDPIFAKLGSINDLSLGNGFIMSNYSNMLFLPEQRIFGLDVGVDGSAFGFPYVGLEALTGNLARFDVVGGRLFARPLVGTSIPILKGMQVGATLVADTKPDLYSPTSSSAKAIAAYGADIFVPLVASKAFPLAAFTDVAVDPNKSLGWMIGLGGRLAAIFTYGAQLRILQDGFIPAYFDSSYDLYRAAKYDYMQQATGSGSFAGWMASLGTSLLGDKLAFGVSLDGPLAMKGPSSNPAGAKQTDYAHLRGIFKLDQIDVIPFYFTASYEKYKLGAEKGFFKDLVDPTDAIVGLDINYKTGASVLTLSYNAKWDPVAGEFDVTSSLRASMKF